MNGAYKVEGGVKVCQASCDGKYVTISVSLKECFDTCPEDHPHDVSNECKKCDGSAEFWTGSACAANCGGKPYKTVGEQKVCVDACTEEGFDYRDGDECKDTCASNYYKVDDNQKRICITETECTTNTFKVVGDLNQCAVTDDCDVSEYKVIKNAKNYCYAGACPTDKPVYDDKKVCTEKCADTKNKYWTGTECKDKCPTGKPVYDTTNYICAEKCSTESYFWDPMAEKCV